jgi:hypothetical protein
MNRQNSGEGDHSVQKAVNRIESNPTQDTRNTQLRNQERAILAVVNTPSNKQPKKLNNTAFH